jgi:hypothetical protein
MGALALCTNANIYAADQIQWYYTHADMRNGAFDFRTWEGQLFKFSASTGTGVTTNKAPVELSQVLDGTAP